MPSHRYSVLWEKLLINIDKMVSEITAYHILKVLRNVIQEIIPEREDVLNSGKFMKGKKIQAAQTTIRLPFVFYISALD